MKLSKLKSNPNNPRIIKDDKFQKLVKSINDFPQMMDKRPIVCVTDTDGKLYPLGGNMRLKALQELNYKDIPENWVTLADEWTIEQRNEFVIKDNVGFGEWDWDDLANNWDSEKINEWGLDIPNWSKGSILNTMNEDDLDFTEEFDPIGTSKGYQRVVFIFDGPEEAESYLHSLHVKFQKRNMAWQVNMNTLST
jgi:hypothetical protein